MIPGVPVMGEPVLGDQPPPGRASGYPAFLQRSQRRGVFLADITVRRKGSGQLLAAPTDILGDPVLGDQPRGGFQLGLPERHFLGSHTFIGPPDDNRRPNVVARPRLRTAISSTKLFPFLPGESRSVQSTDGFVEIANDDGAYDFFPASMTADGLDVSIWHGPRRGYFDDFSLRLRALGRSFDGTDRRTRLQLQNDITVVQKPIASSYYTGLGLLEGDLDIAGLPVPSAFGTCGNVSLVPLLKANQVWQIAQGPLQAINAVYDGGLPLIFAGDYPTLAALIAAPVSAGQYLTCEALGLVRFFENAAFKYTADIQGFVFEGEWLSTLAQITEYLLRRRVGLFANAIDRAAIFGVGAVEAGYFTGTADLQVSDYMEEAARSIIGFHGLGRDGRYRLKRVFAPESYALPQAIPVAGVNIKPEHFETYVRSEQTVRYDRNWTPMTDAEIAPSVSDERRRYLKSQGRSITTPNGSGAAFYPNARPGDPINTIVNSQFWANEIGKEAIKMTGTEQSLYSVELGRRGYSLDGGDPVAFTTDRYGAGGVVWIVKEIQERSEGERFTVKVFGTPRRLAEGETG